ncbi:MAG: N-methylhydantoinase A [Natrialbaceae archaeon]|jgi:N-methylhydantoinase A
MVADETDGESIAVGADVGGTFTDVVLVVGDDLVTAKVSSTDDQSVGVMDGIRKAAVTADIAFEDIEEFSHAMTVSVNALLERDGATTALVTTEGFRDILEIGRQTRPALYDLNVEKPTPLVPRRRRFEVNERTTVDGVETPLDEASVRSLAGELDDAGVESVAVSFLQAYATPENEARAVEILREEFDGNVSASHEVLAEFREYGRTSTTVVDAYVTPTIDAYLARLEERAAERGLPAPRVMQSNGGIADARTVRNNAVQTVLSGPAAGVVGAKRSADGNAEITDLDGLVTFDMGGTSCDVSVVRDGTIERTTESEINEQPIRVPMVDVTTVGSGGGSLAWVDAGGALRVGPESAGADPGPASYGQGGTDPTVTDANVVLGYIGGSTALGGELELDVDAAREVLGDLADEAGLDSPLEAAEGVFRVANAKMARAIRSVTVERGLDPRNYGLVAFGGAGPMHAAAMAAELDMESVVIPLPSGVLSAYGLLDADEKHDAVRTHRTSVSSANADRLDAIYTELEEEVRDEVASSRDPEIERHADLRYAGQSFELQVPVPDPIDGDRLGERFETAHQRTYGYTIEGPVELVNLRATATVPRRAPDTTFEGAAAAPKATREAFFDGEAWDAAVSDRRAVPPGTSVEGPAILEQEESTTVVPPGWAGPVTADGTLALRRVDR